MRKKLVIIDDEDDIREVLRHALEFTRDWIIFDARDGQAGLELIQREHPDAVVLDVMMPKMNGREVFRAIRSDAATAEMPVIFLTASVQRKDIRELEELGPTAVLTKPFDPTDISERIAELLGW